MLTITALTHGPLVIEGEVTVVDANGRPYTPNKPGRIALCRCGQSSVKPFCDGTHNLVGFHCPPQPEPSDASST